MMDGDHACVAASTQYVATSMFRCPVARIAKHTLGNCLHSFACCFSRKHPELAFTVIQLMAAVFVNAIE